MHEPVGDFPNPTTAKRVRREDETERRERERSGTILRSLKRPLLTFGELWS
jgi:hypothetical protein